MVGNDTDRFCRFLVRAVFAAADTLDCGDNGREEVGFVHRFFALKYAKRTFETHARIDVFLFKRLVLAVDGLVELHKHVVPDLEVFAAVAGGRTLVAALGLTVVNEHFAVRSARTRDSGGPHQLFSLGRKKM